MIFCIITRRTRECLKFNSYSTPLLPIIKAWLLSSIWRNRHHRLLMQSKLSSKLALGKTVIRDHGDDLNATACNDWTVTCPVWSLVPPSRLKMKTWMLMVFRWLPLDLDTSEKWAACPLIKCFSRAASSAVAWDIWLTFLPGHLGIFVPPAAWIFSSDAV